MSLSHAGDSRQVEISKLKTEIATKSEANLGLRNQMQDTESYAISLKEETKQQHLEIARLRDLLAVKGDESADFLERIKILEYFITTRMILTFMLPKIRLFEGRRTSS